ncbi:unnamed protein product [Allacma fusca]|uniref:G-protein coupled receptors family 1 profile domain-containing protein n=1 Tax=Allacma fusca TaxID=39272 RepID=A0A8J2L6U4_9HEXA|nr:unnamed protein product [Allacma fusca]
MSNSGLDFQIKQSQYFEEEPNNSIISNVTIIESQVIIKGDYYPWLLSFPLLLFLLVCTCANAIIFVFVFASKTYRSPANYLLANLCLVSTIYIVNLVIFTLEKEYELWSYGPWSCIAASCFHRLPLPLMTLTIMTLSLDRSRIARNPLNHPSKSSVMLQIFLVWSISFALMIPRAMISHYDPDSLETYKCKKSLLLNSRVAQAIYSTMNLLIIHVLPAAYLLKGK